MFSSIDFSVLSFIRDKSAEHKSKLDLLVPNTVKGTFEAHVTIDCSIDTEGCIERLKKACENSKYKIIFINLNTQNKQANLQQLMTSSYHCGEYPTIVEQIEKEAYGYFKDFPIIRVKIEALASNAGVPETDLEKYFFWDGESTYFEFHYKVQISTDKNKNELNKLRQICNDQNAYNLHLSHNAFRQVDENHFHYMITMRLFNVGRQNAFAQNENVITYLTGQNFPPLKVVREFVVYDSYIGLDKDWR